MKKILLALCAALSLHAADKPAKPVKPLTIGFVIPLPKGAAVTIYGKTWTCAFEQGCILQQHFDGTVTLNKAGK